MVSGPTDLAFIQELQQMDLQLREYYFPHGPSADVLMHGEPATPHENDLVRAFGWISEIVSASRQGLYGSSALSTEIGREHSTLRSGGM
jgi:hypothetical protein